MKRFLSIALLAVAASAAQAQSAQTQSTQTQSISVPVKPPAAPANNALADAESDVGATTQPLQPNGQMVLLLRGLDKITGHPTDIVAPIGKPVHFATLTITARYCYSTPPSETPETAAFVQIDDQRPEQGLKRVFSGWMYASSPGLNGMQHPVYDVWAIGCNTNAAPVVASTAPVKVASPDAADKEPAAIAPPPDAGK